MLFQCWTSAVGSGPALKQHWVTSSCLLMANHVWLWCWCCCWCCCCCCWWWWCCCWCAITTAAAVYFASAATVAAVDWCYWLVVLLLSLISPIFFPRCNYCSFYSLQGGYNYGLQVLLAFYKLYFSPLWILSDYHVLLINLVQSATTPNRHNVDRHDGEHHLKSIVLFFPWCCIHSLDL